MGHPELAPAEQDVGLHTPKPELQGIVERMGVRVIVVGIRRQHRTAGASACLTSGKTRTDRGRGDETRENAPTSPHYIRLNGHGCGMSSNIQAAPRSAMFFLKLV